VCRPDECVPRPDASLQVFIILFAFYLPSATTTFFFDLSCHVVCLSRRFLLRFWHSLHISSHSVVISVFLCSFKFLCFTKYWNIFLRYCPWKSYSVYFWVDIYIFVPFGLLYFLLYFLGIQLTAVIIPHFFWEPTGSNLSWWCYFRIYFCLNLFRNMSSSSSQQSVRQMDPLENRLLLKSYIQNPKVSGFRWVFPQLIQSLP
jgi:hypothetical protein